MDEVTIRYWSPHGRQEETKYRCDDKRIDLIMRAAKQVDLSNIRKCSNLTTLNLSNNMLEVLDLSPLKGNYSLTEVRLDNNHLPSLDLWPLGTCTSLSSLNLTNNRLRSLDLTPVLVKANVLLDSSVVISADHILRYLLTTKEISERFQLVRPDRAPWTAPPVLMWETYDILATRMEWSKILERISTILNQVTKDDWYAVQRGLLIGLGLGELAGFDGNPSALIDKTYTSMDYEEARRSIFDRTIELFEEQIENNGPTLFLDIEMMKETRASSLIPKIVEARAREIDNTTVATKGSTALMNSLWLTHYGYKILEALDIGMRHFGVAIEQIKSSLNELGFSLKTIEIEALDNFEMKDPVRASQSMKRFVYNQIEKAYL
ncbi:MAG: hypothetical protein ACFFE7_12795 [Candidatus Thorarchaeota archaeon]